MQNVYIYIYIYLFKPYQGQIKTTLQWNFASYCMKIERESTKGNGIIKHVIDINMKCEAAVLDIVGTRQEKAY